MKKIFKHIVLFVSLSVLVTSCGNDFIDLVPISAASDDGFYKTKADIDVAMPAAYNTLYNIYGAIGPVYFYGSLASDEVYTDDRGSNPADYTGIQACNVQTINGEVYAAWNNFYQCMFRVNNLIQKINQISFDGAAAYEGEMRFLRALYYYNMSQIWGGVPLVTKPVTVAEAYAMGRASLDDVYKQIIEDLEFCIKNLPSKSGQRAVGVATKGAAYALLGKVYLAKGDKANAALTLTNIYNKEYSLTPSYADLWDYNKKNGSESIFEIQYLGGTGNPYSSYWALYSPANNIGAVTLQGGGHNQVSTDLWNAYEANDPRRDISIQDGWKSLTGEFNSTRFPIKWVDKTNDIDGKREMARNNFMVLRYADVLLMLAEATGDVKYLNEVRARVGLPAYGTAGYPSKYNTVALAIEHERNVELALEFHRFFDLKRTGRAVTVMNACWKNITMDAHNLVWPIPSKVIDQNPAVLKPQQNPGYGTN